MTPTPDESGWLQLGRTPDDSDFERFWTAPDDSKWLPIMLSGPTSRDGFRNVWTQIEIDSVFCQLYPSLIQRIIWIADCILFGVLHKNVHFVLEFTNSMLIFIFFRNNVHRSSKYESKQWNLLYTFFKINNLSSIFFVVVSIFVPNDFDPTPIRFVNTTNYHCTLNC